LDESTEYNLTKGLGIISGKVDSIKRFGENLGPLVPRIGWFSIVSSSDNYTHPILDSLSDSSSFYHVHSYMGYEIENEHLIATSQISVDLSAPSIIVKKNVYGFQFHPEKSGKSGLQILKNFVNHT
jgi:glutamine amidotransferase